ncbi:lipopolysaccharide biosynthesis protein [Citrobacter sedlakii]|nr:lipopolysaccharide biosynthesis protein [Citrobacter sedlakii]
MTVKKNVTWVTLSQVSKILLQLLSLTILTRLITPEQYGIMAMAMIITNFALIFRDLGTSAAIIQRKNLTPEITSSIFWLNVIMGFIICCAVLSIAPFIANIFKQEALKNILLILSLSFPLASLGAVHQALLERESRFQLVAVVEIFSSMLGLISAVVLAYFGAGVYSLVFQTLITCISSTSAYWLISNFRPSFTISKQQLNNLIAFSGNLTLFNIINYFSRNVDGIIIGRKFSSVILGSYSLSYRIMLFPIQSLSLIAARSLYPIMSKKQDDLIGIKILYFKTLAIIASITAPMMFGLVIVRELFVNIAFGHQWDIVPDLILWMAPIGFIQSLLSVTGSVLVAQGKTALQMYLGLFSTVLSVLAFTTGAYFSIFMLTKLYLLASIISGLVSLYICAKTLKASFVELLSNIVAPLISAMLMVCFLYYAKALIAFYGAFNDYSMIIIYIIIGAMTYIVSYRLLFRRCLDKIVPYKMRKILFLN